MLCEVFEQGLCGPAVAGGVPVEVVGPTRISGFGALAEDIVALVDDGNAEDRGHLAQPFEHEGSVDLQRVRRQDDQLGAVPVGALLELLQCEGGVLQGVLEKGRQVPSSEGLNYFVPPDPHVVK